MRIRTVKPEFWVSEQIMNLSPLARLLFIGMWNFCDDAGIHPASTRTLKAEVFAGDDVAVAPLMAELIEQGLLMEYEVAGKRFWWVTGWRHQKIDRPTYKHPLPDGAMPDSYRDVQQAFDDYSTNTRRAFTPGMDRSGMEEDEEAIRKGKKTFPSKTQKRNSETCQKPGVDDDHFF